MYLQLYLQHMPRVEYQNRGMCHHVPGLLLQGPSGCPANGCQGLPAKLSIFRRLLALFLVSLLPHASSGGLPLGGASNRNYE